MLFHFLRFGGFLLVIFGLLAACILPDAVHGTDHGYVIFLSVLALLFNLFGFFLFQVSHQKQLEAEQKDYSGRGFLYWIAILIAWTAGYVAIKSFYSVTGTHGHTVIGAVLLVLAWSAFFIRVHGDWHEKGIPTPFGRITYHNSVLALFWVLLNGTIDLILSSGGGSGGGGGGFSGGGTSGSW